MAIEVGVRRRVLLLAVSLAILTCAGCALLARTSVGVDGEDPDGTSTEPAVSEDGRFVAFVSEATNLVAGDTNGRADVFIRDHLAATTELVSPAAGGGGADGPSTEPAVSEDGRFVAFVSEATNLVAGDTNGRADVFIRDRLAGTTERVSVDDDGHELSWSSGSIACLSSDESSCVPTLRGVAMSGDGSHVAFVSRDLGDGRPAILHRDRTAATTTEVVVSAVGPDGPTTRYTDLAMSRDGTTVAYTTELVGPEGAEAGLQTVELAVGAPETIAGASAATESLGCCHPDLSGDGRYVTFHSEGLPVPEDDDVAGCPGDPQHCFLDLDAFLFDRDLGTYERVSVTSDGDEVDGGSGLASVSDDGSRVAFASIGPVVDGVSPGPSQLYVRDRSRDDTSMILAGGVGGGPSDVLGTISGDGSAVALATDGTERPGVDGTGNIYLAMTDAPHVDGVATVESGGAAQVVTLTGRDFQPGLRVDSLAYDVEIGAVDLVSANEVEVTVSTPSGAALGLRQLVVSNVGPYGTTAATHCACLDVTWDYAPHGPTADQPDIIVINTDDQRWDSMDQFPLMEDRPGWATFANSFVHEPMCCPSRATAFTGQYGHRNGVTSLRDGGDLDEDLTVATLLDDAGYRTFLGGKYLNGYPFGGDSYRPPGWDDFVVANGRNQSVPTAPGGTTPLVPHFNYAMWDNGVRVKHTDGVTEYATDRYFAEAREFVREADPSDPLYLYVAPMSPHSPLIPHPRHSGACAERSFPMPPGFNAYDTVGEPSWMAAALPYDPAAMANQLRLTCEMLQSIDEGVVSLLDELEAAGRLDNAYIVFTSDNGYLFGEHRLVGKGALYEESIRVPLWVRGPNIAPGVVARLTSNVDLVPTVLDWAGVAAPPGFLDGQSFADDASGTDTLPNPSGILLFGCRTGYVVSTDCGGYREPMGTAWGVRTASHKYVRYEDGYEQLFDLVSDPSELTNLALDPANAALVASLRQLTVELRGFDNRLSGMVRDSVTGHALPGVEVHLHDGATWTATTTTGPSGDYTFSDLPPGPYVVRFDDPTGGHLTEFHDDRSSIDDADPVVLGPIDSLVADVRLAPD